MSLIQSTLSQFFLQYPKLPIVVAYSGGIDSQVLLHALAQLKQQQKLNNSLSVCHVNHGISEFANDWQEAAQQLCHTLSIPLIVCNVEIKPLAQHSLEALAREARYKALSETSPANALIVTGHHSDDQSETFLLALKRGAGLKGLSAMVPVSTLINALSEPTSEKKSDQKLVRPLLVITRNEIENYAKTHQLTWVEDESNQDNRFDRNFIRHKVMPLLTQRWPSILKTIQRSSEHCMEGQQLLTELAVDDLAKCQCDEFSLSVTALSQLSLARFNNLLRYFLTTQHCLMPSTQQLQQVFQQLLAATDKTPEIKIGKRWLRRYKKRLYLTDDFKDVSHWQVTVNYENIADTSMNINLPDSLGSLSFSNNEDNRLKTPDQFHTICTPSASQKVSIRFQHQNPRCLPDFRQHSRPLKKVLQELSIAPWQRKRIPYLYYDDTLVAVIGYFVCQQYVPQVEGNTWDVCWNTLSSTHS